MSDPRPEYRVIVFGGRDYADAENVARALGTVHERTDAHGYALVVVQGGAAGADSLARQWASAHGVRCETFPADWKTHGRAAGPLRNQAMLDAGAAYGVGFPGGRGTADMARRLRAAGVDVFEATP